MRLRLLRSGRNRRSQPHARYPRDTHALFALHSAHTAAYSRQPIVDTGQPEDRYAGFRAGKETVIGTRTALLAGLVGLAATVVLGTSGGASVALAQSWLPWATREEPARRPPPRRQPIAPQQGQQWGQQPDYGVNRGSICLQLEQRLAQDAQRQANTGQARAGLENELRAAQREMRRAERQLDQRQCYETFLFTRSLRPTQTCRKLDRDFRRAERRIEEVMAEINNLNPGQARDRQDEIIRALARNGCGPQYEQEARRRNQNFSNFWQDNESDRYGGRGNTFGGLPFATYRTLCVRLCDGYYFPVSFSTLPTHFDRDAEACQQRCAAPTELYFHQNPGGSVDQMVSRRTQQPYTTLRSAFRYRKEYVAGCSCKASEYIPQTAEGGPATSSLPPAQANNGTAPAQPDNKLSPVR